MVNNFFLNQKP